MLMDLEMPGLDGLDAAREIRRCEPWPMPIIALTAHAMEQDRRRCLDAGINQHLTKPVNPSRLLAEIARWARPAALGTERSAAPGCSQPPSIDIEVVGRLMADVDALLASNNIAAEERALWLRKALDGQGVETLLDELERAVDRLDYPGARTILASLSGVLSSRGLALEREVAPG